MSGNILDPSCWFCRRPVHAHMADYFGKDETSEPGEFVSRWVHSLCIEAADKAWDEAKKA